MQKKYPFTSLAFLLLCLFSSVATKAQKPSTTNLISEITVEERPFITIWETTTNNETITIPVNQNVFNQTDYNYTVDWGDGTIVTNITTDVSHIYELAGTYSVKVSGTFPGFNFGKEISSLNRNNLKAIAQWGTISWRRLTDAFRAMPNITITATDSPNLTNVTHMDHMFAYVDSFTGDISGWDVSNVTDMSYIFRDVSSFNSDISNWNVSNVTNMSNMFNGASSFNRDISGWDISNVDDMLNMFKDSGISSTTYDKILIGWNANENTPRSIELGSVPVTYCDGASARANLVAPTRGGDIRGQGWTITDLGENCQTLSIKDAVITDNVKVSPNPANDFIEISSINNQVIKNYTIVNIYGQQVLKGVLSNPKTTVNIDDLATGIYFLQINSNTIKVIKK